MYGPPDSGSTLTFGRRPTGRHARAPGALPCSAPTTRIATGVGPFTESPKSPIRFTVCASSDSSGGNCRAQVGIATLPSLRTIRKSAGWIVARRMNQLNVTGMLSSPCSPPGQPTALSVPHEALRILGLGRAVEPAPLAVVANADTSRDAPRAASAHPCRRRIEDRSRAGIELTLVAGHGANQNSNFEVTKCSEPEARAISPSPDYRCAMRRSG